MGPPDAPRPPAGRPGGEQDTGCGTTSSGEATGGVRHTGAASSRHRRGALVIYTERREMVLGATVDRSFRDELDVVRREHPWSSVRVLARELLELLVDCERVTLDPDGRDISYGAVYEGRAS